MTKVHRKTKQKMEKEALTKQEVINEIAELSQKPIEIAAPANPMDAMMQFFQQQAELNSKMLQSINAISEKISSIPVPEPKKTEEELREEFNQEQQRRILKVITKYQVAQVWESIDGVTTYGEADHLIFNSDEEANKYGYKTYGPGKYGVLSKEEYYSPEQDIKKKKKEE